MATSDFNDRDAALLEMIHATRDALTLAKQHRSVIEVAAVENRLRRAVENARDADISWMLIGDALDMTRGNAYQRYRRRPAPHGHPHVA